jgi:hypothetical protein
MVALYWLLLISKTCVLFGQSLFVQFGICNIVHAQISPTINVTVFQYLMKFVVACLTLFRAYVSHEFAVTRF